MAKFRKRLFYKKTQVNSFGNDKNGGFHRRVNTFTPRKFSFKFMSFQNISSFLMTLPGLLVTAYVLYNLEGVKSWFSKFFISLSINNPLKKDVRILYDAMNYIGTDTKSIFNVLKDKTESQYLDLVKEFGIRKYDRVWGKETESYLPFTKNEDLDLSSWLKEELTAFAKFNLLKMLPYLVNYGF